MVLPFTNAAPSLARNLVLTNRGVLHEPMVEDAVLLVSELVTNALMHGQPPIVVSINTERGVFEAEVRDGGTRPFRLNTGPVAETSVAGRGLQIMNAVAAAWTIDPVPDGSGVRVWFKLHGSTEAL